VSNVKGIGNGQPAPATAAEPAQLNRDQVRKLGLAQLAESGVTEADLGLLKIEFVTALDIRTRRLSIAAAPGILHHYFLPNHQTNGLRRVRYLRGYEPDDPQRPGHKMRYGHPKGVPPELYLVPTMDWEAVFRDPTRPLYFTEGWLKAIAAAKMLDLPVLAYDGIWSFGKDGVLLPIYNEIVWRGRTVYLLNDADVTKNPESLRAENTHAHLLMERAVEQVLIARYPKGCKQGKLDDVLMAKGAKWYTQQILKKAVAWDPAMTEGEEIPVGLVEEPVRAPVVVPPMPRSAMYGLAGTVTKAFDCPPSLTYPAVLVALASGGLPIQGETRGTLYGILLNVSGGCKSVITDRAEQLMAARTTVLRTLPASDRGLLNMLQFGNSTAPASNVDLKPANVMLPSVLLIVDELKNLLCKANIENSNLYSCLNELFYHTTFPVSDRKGVHNSSPVNFNLLGNLPCSNPAQFTELFGHDSQEGFYRRCLFGLGIRAEPFVFHPVGDTLKTLLTKSQPKTTPLRATRAMHDKVEAWKQASANEEQRARREGLGELIIRVALVTSSANADTDVTDKAFDAAVAFIQWQEQIRTVYAPARAKSPYAQCMDMVLSYLDSCKGLVNWRRVSQTEHWHRREFSQYLPAIKRYLLNEGMLLPVPAQKGLFYYKKEDAATQ
jgi:hypothetical protein